ncbi:uncharacterized protein LOC104875457 [Fukomys damarensis]|uniref:uncharacterized protein LOC104875457 n=1 Tax=Fukomys damarensis TaxID=885580 RepID=UPI0008FED363|nr:uncharacterized protein LOC104875457 [Fukomys damarensis]
MHPQRSTQAGGSRHTCSLMLDRSRTGTQGRHGWSSNLSFCCRPAFHTETRLSCSRAAFSTTGSHRLSPVQGKDSCFVPSLHCQEKVPPRADIQPCHREVFSYCAPRDANAPGSCCTGGGLQSTVGTEEEARATARRNREESPPSECRAGALAQQAGRGSGSAGGYGGPRGQLDRRPWYPEVWQTTVLGVAVKASILKRKHLTCTPGGKGGPCTSRGWTQRHTDLLGEGVLPAPGPDSGCGLSRPLATTLSAERGLISLLSREDTAWFMMLDPAEIVALTPNCQGGEKQLAGDLLREVTASSSLSARIQHNIIRQHQLPKRKKRVEWSGGIGIETGVALSRV